MIVTGIVARQVRQEIGEIVLVGRRKKNLGRAADAEPGVGSERRVGGQTPAQLGRPPRDLGGPFRPAHAATPSSAASSAGSA